MVAFGKKRLLGLVVGFAVMVSFFVAPPLMAKQLHFAVLLPTMDQPHFILQRYGYEEEAKKFGIKLTIYDAGGYANLTKQISQIEDATASKVDAIILVSVDMTGTIPAVEDAIRVGIPVINVNVMCNSPKIIARVRSDDIEIGRMRGEFVAEKLNFKGNVVSINGPAGASVVSLRRQGFREVIAKYPNVKIIDEKFVAATRVAAMNTMEDFLQTYGMKINAAETQGEMGTMGIAKVLEAANRRDVIVAGADWSKDLEKAIRDGWVAGTVLQQTIMMGRLGIRTAKDVVDGKKVPPITYSPIFLITKENIDTIDRSGFELPK
jgi:ABC-type sugar transport system substrate-binding protein